MTLQTLQERQAWTLPQKIDHALGVIEAFASWFDGKVYVSYSGGKDSVVMLSLVEMILPNVPCVFIMTGCESPSVCRFVRQQKEHHNIEFIRPQKTLKQVFAEYGFPLVSKQTAYDIEGVRRNPYSATSRKKLWLGNRNHIPERWMYLLNEPYQVSSRCCFWLKHQPAFVYEKRTGRKPYLGLLASESRQRTLGYIQQGGCNVFEVSGKNRPRSMPLAIWTEQDVWDYIRDRHLDLPDIYEQGATRTGCMGCGFGVHIHPEGLDTMRRLWPKWYDIVMNYENNGIRYGDALDRMMDSAKNKNGQSP